MSRFWRWWRWFWLDSREHTAGVFVEQLKAWQEAKPQIKPIELPTVKPLEAHVVKAKRAPKQRRAVLPMRRSG